MTRYDRSWLDIQPLTHSQLGMKMNKLIAVLVAGMFGLGSAAGFAADSMKKDDAKTEAKKEEKAAVNKADKAKENADAKAGKTKENADAKAGKTKENADAKAGKT